MFYRAQHTLIYTRNSAVVSLCSVSPNARLANRLVNTYRSIRSGQEILVTTIETKVAITCEYLSVTHLCTQLFFFSFFFLAFMCLSQTKAFSYTQILVNINSFNCTVASFSYHFLYSWSSFLDLDFTVGKYSSFVVNAIHNDDK